MNSTKIIAIDDNREVLLSLRILLGKYYDEVICFPKPCAEAEQALANDDVHLVLLDMNFTAGATSGREGLDFLERIRAVDPSVSVVLMTAYGDIDLAVNAMKLGATDFVVKPWENKKLLATVSAAQKLTLSNREVHSLRDTQRVISEVANSPFNQIIGQSKAMESVFSTIKKVAKTDANVLILGENGTGKELVARAIHRHSGRASNVFMTVDMGSIAETLFESELFGHTKGAFTDAKEERAGRFEAANHGTLFLDEIANIPQTLQAKLLSVLQNREVTRLGSLTSKRIDIRLISATNANINHLVEVGSFRQDLYYRVNTVEVHIPPLRDREEDIFLLANHFLEMYAGKYGKTRISLSKAAQRLIKSYSWPGNVRELRHALERAVIMCDGKLIEPDSLFLNQNKTNLDSSVGEKSLNIEDVEKQTIVQALKVNKGNVSLAAKELGLGRTTLYRKMAKYGL
ncbi:MAG: sigma-54 dependent transcriptional regulator [Tenuifilaceae bacterium]|jgi:DNA-binding NtrC family response regulator|nr:sigma-54 dependent transcriptional regulator [Tenuifilaceae bacterium]